MELAPVYDPHQVEERIYQFWLDKGYFAGKINQKKKPFSLVIPPPNITGILHMGHVMDNTPQDIIVRFKRMQGYETTWVPGTDHAGIATQNVVEKKLAEEGTSRQALGRTKFVERVWQWREKHGNTIIQQLKRLGCSCDWARLRFTMDEDYSRAVTEVFCRLYERGLIYRGHYIINWCPRCQTALSDEEVEHREIEGALYWIRYPLKSDPDKYVVVATTRPETMLGDTAVTVHPDDKRYKTLVNQIVILPILNREIPLIADSFANPEFGSGAVKVTPAHDPNDFEIGKRHNLPSIIAIGPDGRMNEQAGPYEGQDRFECRKNIIKDLDKQGLFEKKEKHFHAVGHCYRCETMIEPYLSEQWFVRMKPLAEPGIKAVQKGKVRFFPDRWTKVYLNWMENIRDWCISRQLWWGHRIPVWYCLPKADPPRAGQKTEARKQKSEDSNPQSTIRNPQSECPPIVSRTPPKKCPKCGGKELEQDPDVLDTWFSSWLWPFVLFGWPNPTPDMEYFYPTSVLNSGKEILFFWDARMIMAGLEFTGKVPFKDIYIHGIARDHTGRKLSKSLGNSPDPIDLIAKYSADALRFGIMANIPLGGDPCLSDNMYISGRNFCNKLWNASRLVLSKLPQVKELPKKKKSTLLPFEDRWILSRLNSTIRDYTKALEVYEFSAAAHIIYQFFWHDLCDWYLEIIKPRLYEDIDDTVLHTNLLHVFDTLLRMLHPFIPFVTEEIWQKFKSKAPKDWAEAVMIAPWPKAESKRIDSSVEKTMSLLIDIVRGVRDIRNKMDIEPRKPLGVFVSTNSNALSDTVRVHAPLIKYLGYVDKVEAGINMAAQPCSATFVGSGFKAHVPLEGVIDFEVERKRLETRLKKLEAQLMVVRGKLANKNFLKRAPEVIVDKEKQKSQELSDQISKLSGALKDLS